jgi:hypothetical protein
MSVDGSRTAGELAERRWLEREVAAARHLSDAERVQILLELIRAHEAIERGKTPEERRRDEAVRRALDEPGRERYRRLAERRS